MENGNLIKVLSYALLETELAAGSITLNPADLVGITRLFEPDNMVTQSKHKSKRTCPRSVSTYTTYIIELLTYWLLS